MTSQDPMIIDTQVYSKKTPIEVSDEVSREITNILEKEFGIEHRLDEVAPLDAIGTFHQYRTRLITEQGDNCLIEIRGYDRRAQKDNRAVIIMSTSIEDFKEISVRISEFYSSKGYEQIHFRTSVNKQLWEKRSTKF